MNRKFRSLVYSLLFFAIFIAKMIISTAPIVLDLDKKVVNAAILQLELENNSKESGSDAKDINDFLKKGTEFIHVYDFVICPPVFTEKVSHHQFLRAYIKTYFPSVPTPPPNEA